MTNVTRKLLVAHLCLLAAGATIGWLYGQVITGLLIAALLGLGWQLRQLLRFERALRSKHFGSLKYGDSVWSQLYSNFSHQRRAGPPHRSPARRDRPVRATRRHARLLYQRQRSGDHRQTPLWLSRKPPSQERPYLGWWHPSSRDPALAGARQTRHCDQRTCLRSRRAADTLRHRGRGTSGGSHARWNQPETDSGRSLSEPLP